MDPDDSDTLSRAPYQRIAWLDPLNATPWLARLPTLNLEADVPGIVAAVRAIVPTIDQAAAMDTFAAAAATRDLGMFLASLKRHGVEPVEAVPEVEAVMLRFGVTTGMSPRETVLHYTHWNPAGPNQRRFTDDPSEGGLIDAARLAAPWIHAAVDLLAEAYKLPSASDAFVEACAAAAQKLEQLAEAMVVVRARVDPAFFATTLRPYFESIRLGDRQYSGAAAAPLGVGMIDHLLWSSDLAEPVYRDVQDHLIEYGLPRDKRLYASTLGRPSIVARFVAAAPDPRLDPARRALNALFRVLIAFRSRHLVVAQVAYAENIRRYLVGSAGYGVDTLGLLLEHTKGARRRLLTTG